MSDQSLVIEEREREREKKKKKKSNQLQLQWRKDSSKQVLKIGPLKAG